MKGLTLVAAAVALTAGTAHAHHEAIFGPQSSVFLSEPDVLSSQLFTKRGESATGEAVQDTTLLLSAGYAPFDRVPLSAVLSVPIGMTTGGDEDGHPHLEDLILGARYRLDLRGLQESLGREGNYLLVTAAAELPTGTGHGTHQRRVNGLFGALGSVEYRAVSAVLFGFGTLNAAGSGGDRAGHELFAGGGLAYTPVDTHEYLVSLQLGLSFERYFEARDNGASVAASGGRQFVLSPTAVVGFHESWQLFAMVGVPFAQRWDDPSADESWRAALGVVWAFDQ